MLRCRRCKLEKINGQVYNLLQHLEELDLGDNQVNYGRHSRAHVCTVDNVCFSARVHRSQLKYLEREEFYDLRRLTHIRLDGNRLSVVIDHLFERQKNLRFIGTLWSARVGGSVYLILNWILQSRNGIRLPVNGNR